jgi:hypothetical protein
MRTTLSSVLSNPRLRRLLTVSAAATLSLGYVLPACSQELSGVVTLADSDPVGGARVELHSVTESAGALIDSTVTDPSGRFEFSLGVAAEPGAVFLVGARHGGVLYWGPPIHTTNPDDLSDYSVAVFDTALVSSAVESLQTTIRHVMITPGVSGLQVQEIIDIAGASDVTLLAASDSGLVWTGALARDAQLVVPSQGGVPGEDLAVMDGMVGFAGALPPSGVRVAIQYLVPSTEYSLRLDHPTDRLELLVMPQPGMDLQVDGLTEASVSAEMRVPVRRFAASDLAEGAAVSARFEFEEPGRGRAWIWFLVSLALGAAALLSVRLTARAS